MQAAEQAVHSPVEIPIGQINTFGPIGDMYQVIKALRPLENGDWMVQIRRIESGEDAEYRLSRILSDPRAV